MIGYLLKIKLKTYLYALLLACISFLIIYEFNLHNKIMRTSYHRDKENVPILMWWTQFMANDDNKELICANNVKCIFTQNRKYFQDPNTAAFIFYGSNFIPYDLPLPRKKSDRWAILHEESPKNLGLFLHQEAQELFNITSTFSRYSHFPITLQYLSGLEALTDRKYFISTENKNTLLNHLSPVMYIQSDCVTPLERDSYVSELMQYLSVDSYGKCMNNKVLPEEFTKDPLQHLYSERFMSFVAQYKFTLAFENAVCDDYITEKLWRPLIAGSVPIYIGSPTIQDWLPNNKSVIIASHFDSPRELADYILKLNSDDALYESYLQHKLSARVDNRKLVQSLRERQWGIDETDSIHFIEAFECFVCECVHQDIKLEIPNPNHYNCPVPISPITREKNESNWWINHWHDGKCQARVLRNYLNDHTVRNFTKESFDNENRYKTPLINSFYCL
ncbi:alpha13-fucosyltransferase B [Carabus blaptoides fortunei]